MVARLRVLAGDGCPAIAADLGVHEEVEAVVHVVGRETVFALRLGLNVMTIGMGVESVSALVEIGAAARKQHVVAPDRILENVHERPLTRRLRPQEGALGRIEAVHCASAAAMHEFLVVMQVEAIEVDALQAFDLLDAKDLPGLDLERLARPWLQDHLDEDIPVCHCAAPLLCFAACSRSALRISATRSAASPRSIVRSMSSSCCWLRRTTTVLPAIPPP